MFQRCTRCGVHVVAYTRWAYGRMCVKYLCPRCDREKLMRMSDFNYIHSKGVTDEQKSKK